MHAHILAAFFFMALSSSLALTQCDRRAFFFSSMGLCFPTIAGAKCTDIESCREIGDKKVEQDLKDNPVTTLKDGVRFKQLKPGFGDNTVGETATVDLIYSLSRGGGSYMYSQGFGFEKIDIGNGPQRDLGLDSYRISMKKGDIPVGIEEALVGMKKGERRRIELPPSVGFETSNWKPEPKTDRARAAVTSYRRILRGNGSNQPPFAEPTIWDVEVLSFRN